MRLSPEESLALNGNALTIETANQMIENTVGVFGMPAEIVYTKMFPGTALGVLVGNVLYTRMAITLARREGRSDVTAMPLGLDAPTSIGMALLVLGPAFAGFRAQGLDADAAGIRTWQLGMAALVIMGALKFVLAFFGDAVRRNVPRAGLPGQEACVRASVRLAAASQACSSACSRPASVSRDHIRFSHSPHLAAGMSCTACSQNGIEQLASTAGTRFDADKATRLVRKSVSPKGRGSRPSDTTTRSSQRPTRAEVTGPKVSRATEPLYRTGTARPQEVK